MKCRPISNLKFICKMIEKAISYQLTNYLRDNDLEESLQSAYKTFHGTKTTLVKVHNDIVSEIDNQSYVILLLLDLSAVFDTVDHKIVLQRLSCRFGIDGKALRWFKSYLENRKQVVNVKGSTSCSNWGVAYPKDLCWGLYCMYCTRSAWRHCQKSWPIMSFLRWWHPALLLIQASWSSGFSASSWVLFKWYWCMDACKHVKAEQG